MSPVNMGGTPHGLSILNNTPANVQTQRNAHLEKVGDRYSKASTAGPNKFRAKRNSVQVQAHSFFDSKITTSMN